MAAIAKIPSLNASARDLLLNSQQAYPGEARPACNFLGDTETGRQPRSPQVDAVSAQRYALVDEEPALPSPHRQRPVGMHDAMPGQAFFGGGKNMADKTWRFRFDVSVRADKADRNRAHAIQDAGCALVVLIALCGHSHN